MYFIGNSAGESSGMLTNHMSANYDRNHLLIAFQNTGDEHHLSYEFLHEQEKYWNTEFFWHEYDFVEGFEEAVLKRPATYEALEECVKEGSGFAGMYHTQILDKIAWNGELRKGMTLPKQVSIDKEKGQQNLFGFDYWEIIETAADYSRMLKDFYALFNKKRGNLNESRFLQVDYKNADRNGIPFLKVLLYKNAIRYAKRLPYILPNVSQRFSTGDMKIRVSDDFIRSIGLRAGKDFKKCLGIRYDEHDRYLRNLQTDGSIWMPLYEMRVTENDVRDHWDKMPFQLKIRYKKWLGNCVDCYLKSRLRRIKACQESPAHFWRRSLLEKAARDVMKRGQSSEDIMKLAVEMLITEEMVSADNEVQFTCFCS